MVATKERQIGRQEAEDRAVREVDGYVERMREQKEKGEREKVVGERRKEEGTEEIIKLREATKKGTVQVQDDQGRIVLPLEEDEMKMGKKKGMKDAWRWLVESCNLLIKKYPGRVFYKSKQNSQDE